MVVLMITIISSELAHYADIELLKRKDQEKVNKYSKIRR
jgi:predicted class III extradiol MEMO1 family dioxygenase